MFEKRPDGEVEGTVLEIRVAYDQYGIVSIQYAPLDKVEDDSVQKQIEVLKAAIEALEGMDEEETMDDQLPLKEDQQEVDAELIMVGKKKCVHVEPKVCLTDPLCPCYDCDQCIGCVNAEVCQCGFCPLYGCKKYPEGYKVPSKE